MFSAMNPMKFVNIPIMRLTEFYYTLAECELRAGNKAKAADVIEIIMHVQQRVKEEYGQELQPEVRFIGFS